VNIGDRTYYLRADLDVELSSALPGELLPTSEFLQGRGPFDMGCPMAIPIPSLEVDGLYAGEERLPQYQVKALGVPQIVRVG
jgi:hypothetical protein